MGVGVTDLTPENMGFNYSYTYDNNDTGTGLHNLGYAIITLQTVIDSHPVGYGQRKRQNLNALLSDAYDDQNN